MDAIELKGKWWIDQMDDDDDRVIPNSAVAGKVSFSPEEGGELELIGGFSDSNGIFEEQKLSEPTTIYGVSTEGEFVSLLNCTSINTNMSANQITFSTETYDIRAVVRGGLVEPESKFWKCTFSFDNLENWLGIRSVSTPGDFTIPPGPAYTEELSTDNADIILSVHEDARSLLGNSVDRAYFSIFVDDPLSIGEFASQYIRPLQNLVTLGVGEPVFPTFISVYSEQFGPRDSRHKITRRIPYYRDKEEINSHYMKFTLQDINFTNSIQWWLTNYEKVNRLHDNYFGTEYNDKMYVRTQFFSLMSALEAYHRRTFPEKQKTMTKIAFNRFKKSTLPKIPCVTVHERIENLFNSIVNEPSIGDRLIDITDRHESAFPEDCDIDSNLSSIKNIRHNIVHSLSEDFTTTEIEEAKISLRIIVLAILLESIGLTDTKCQEILSAEHERIERIIEL